MRIITLQEHILTMVRLNHKIIGSSYKVVHFLCNVSDIGDEAEAHIATFHRIAHVISAIMRNTKWSDSKLTESERHTLLYDVYIFGRNFLANTIVFVDALMYLMCRIYRQMVVIADATDRFHMVGVIMCYQDMMNVFKSQAIIMKMFFQAS